jgi:hypothetical protein
MSGLAWLLAAVSPSAAAYAAAQARVAAVTAEEVELTLAAADLVGVDHQVVAWVSVTRPYSWAEIRQRLLAGEGPGWVKQWKEQQ